MKIKKTLLIIIGLLVLSLCLTIEVGAKDNNITDDCVTFFEHDESFTKFVWENKYEKNKRVTNMSKHVESLFDEFEVNAEEAASSAFVYVQSERVHYDSHTVFAPDGYGFSENGVMGPRSDLFFQNEFTHPDGYIRFVTKAYQIGMYDGALVYHIEVDAHYLSSFFIEKHDDLVIQHDNNAVTYGEYDPYGSITKHLYSWDYLGNTVNDYDYIENAIVDTAGGNGGGVAFEVDITTVFSQELQISITNRKVTGHHYIVATDTTAVLPSYVHNYSLFVPSLTLNFGYIGVGIQANAINADVMGGRPLTLPGYSDRIDTKVLNLNPSQYGFEQQYFFYEKTCYHSINTFNFETKRLRCGYIEQQYINLSSNRIGAGNAYLIYNFEDSIYEFEVDLAYWSSNEMFYNTTGYLQYKDNNGNWVTLLDLLDSTNQIPTNRNYPKHFHFYIIEGTTSIRFISTTQNPTADRNKGRICIGNMKFVSYEIN